jgi:hypothetical protein
VLQTDENSAYSAEESKQLLFLILPWLPRSKASGHLLSCCCVEVSARFLKESTLEA